MSCGGPHRAASARSAGTSTEATTATVRDIDEQPTVELTVSAESVCFLIIKAREFDAKDEVTEPDPGSNPADDGDLAVLEDHPDDPSDQEIRAMVNAMSVHERADLVALAWLGRGDYDAREWAAARREAADTHEKDTAKYLLGLPLLGDYLEEGLAMIGRSCEEFEINRL